MYGDGLSYGELIYSSPFSISSEVTSSLEAGYGIYEKVLCCITSVFIHLPEQT